MKVSLVTGASSGLGRRVAQLLCQKSHKVYVVARRKDLLLGLREECKKDPGEIHVVVGDLTSLKFRESLIALILKKQGKLDYLINNAGFGRATYLDKQDPKEISKMFELNIVAYSHLAKLALQDMKKKNQGRIINIGSVVAFTPLPYFTIYNATKAAVYMFNRSLRYELKDLNITSTVVLPSRMKTGFAKVAYDCYEKNGQTICVERFNKIAGDPLKVAKAIVKKIDKGKEVITPTFKSKLWYFMRYFGFATDFVMKNKLGPEEKKHLDKMKKTK